MATRAITLLSADEIAELLVTVIQGVAGRSKCDWRRAIGAIERLPTWSTVTHNWGATPIGTPAERDIVERPVAVVGAEHPYIA